MLNLILQKNDCNHSENRVVSLVMNPERSFYLQGAPLIFKPDFRKWRRALPTGTANKIRKPLRDREVTVKCVCACTECERVRQERKMEGNRSDNAESVFIPLRCQSQ